MVCTWDVLLMGLEHLFAEILWLRILSKVKMQWFLKEFFYVTSCHATVVINSKSFYLLFSVFVTRMEWPFVVTVKLIPGSKQSMYPCLRLELICYIFSFNVCAFNDPVLGGNPAKINFRNEQNGWLVGRELYHMWSVKIRRKLSFMTLLVHLLNC